MSTLRVVLTGGGTAGHVVPALAVHASAPPPSPEATVEWAWIGHGEPERSLVSAAGIPFYAIPAGKLRRYFSFRNLTDLFRVLGGIVRAWRLLGRLKPHIVFSKGGFVAVPVGIAAWLRRIPLLTHESDASPGLATRILGRIATHVLLGQETPARWKAATTVVGNPVRPALRHGDAARARARFQLPADRPLIFVTGGSLGAQAINALIASIAPQLLERAVLLHQTGAGKGTTVAHPGYAQRPFLDAEEVADTLAAATIVIARAGAGTLAELAATGKTAVLIPLPRSASRGDQIENAARLAAAGAAVALDQDTLDAPTLLATVTSLLDDPVRRRELADRLAATVQTDAAERICGIMLQLARARASA